MDTHDQDSTKAVDDFHQMKTFVLTLPQVISGGKANRMFRELGATLHYDVYSFDLEFHEIWQSESLLYIELLENGEERCAQDDFDQIVVSYPFATRPSSDQSLAIDVVKKIAGAFSAKAVYNNAPLEKGAVQEDWDRCSDFLLKEWGEEPGSESLRYMIEQSYA